MSLDFSFRYIVLSVPGCVAAVPFFFFFFVRQSKKCGRNACAVGERNGTTAREWCVMDGGGVVYVVVCGVCGRRWTGIWGD